MMIVSDVVKEGVVMRVTAAEATVMVSCDDTACRGCKISALCGSGRDRIELSVKNDSGQDIDVGDRVVVIGRIKGWLAGWLLLAGLPIMALLAAVVAGFLLGLRDGAIGGLAIVVLIIYYLILYCLRRRIDNRVEWAIESVIH
jgi:sigma-E factor negative regulatory protein RseC